MSANYYELLKYAATGIASPGMTAYDKMRALAMSGGGAIKTLTGVPPLSFRANGKPLISWSMLGNGQQTGTPTHDAPIMPTFCGVRTGNLWNEEYPNISGTIRYIPLYVGSGSFTLSTTTPYDDGVANLFLLSGNVSTGASTAGNGAWLYHNVTAQSESGYITIAFRHYSGTTSPADCKTMLNSGSTALPYEPYGYKIQISCAGQTTPVYLGQTQTVRRVKKLVLDGAENWRKSSDGNIYIALSPNRGVPWARLLSTHFTSSQVQTNGNLLWFVNANVDFDTVEECKSYLSAQYAAGTPVTVWYVLAEPETEIINGPLAKIGDYADELSSTDAGVTIPTAKGQNTLTVETDLQPSEMTIMYRK
jgi:hypothetical protein